jgi:amino acid adenylation domain-containing protein
MSLFTPAQHTAEALVASPGFEPIQARIAAHALHCPDAVAVACEGQSLSYADLHARANAVAHRLRTLGAAPNTLVAVAMERSVDLVVALLGVLRAGAAYLPIDVGHPRERIAFTLADGQPRVVIGSPSVLAQLPQGPWAVLDINDCPASASPAPCNTPVGADDLAYVIYTSGSTGKPKGCQLTHGNVARLFTATAHWFGFGPQDVWTFFHSHAFDFSVWEIWGALVHGGKVVVVPSTQSRSPQAFLQLLIRERVTVLNQTPTAFRGLIEADQALRPVRHQLALRCVIFGGEALDLQMLKPWTVRHGDSAPQLVNMYGITETTVHVTYRPITQEDIEQQRGSVIGVPIPDLSLHVLDEQMQPVAVGDVGELYVGGAGVCAGYLNRPELNAQRFVLWTPPGQPRAVRLYRSGDLARPLADGDLEYLGRNDHQVKIRGFRIETGEIEAALQTHPAVRSAVVVASTPAGGEPRLVAYLIAHGGATASATVLRQHLLTFLPDYMVPVAFVWLDAFPMTDNGKLDRKALPPPSRERPELSVPYEAPQVGHEALWCSLFAHALDLDRVGRGDHFFELGGHSVLAARLMVQAAERSGVRLPMHAVFAHPTPQGLAALMASPATAHALPEIAVDPQRWQAPLSNMQQRLWFQEQLIPGRLDNLLPSAHRLRGALNEAALQAAWHCVLERQAALRTRFDDVDGQPMQLVEPAATHAMLAMLKPGTAQDLSGLDEASRMAALHQGIEALMATPLPLHTAPLARVALYRLAPDDHVLVFVIHHLVWDGVSFDLLCAELGQAYAHFAAGAQRAAVMQALPRLPLSMLDHAAWHAQVFGPQGLAGPAQVAQWRERLAPLPEGLDLPTDRPRPARMTGRGQTVAFQVPAATVHAVRRLATQLGTTPYAVLLATYATLLYRLSGQDDMVVATPANRRDQADLLPVMGFFVNTLPLRVRANPAQPFSALVQHTSQVVREAMAAPDVPLDGLVRALGLPPNASRSQLYQALFAHQDMREQTRQWGRGENMLRHELLPQHASGAAQDLGLWLLEHPSDLGDAMTGGLAYNADLFEPATAQRLVERYLVLLDAALAAPNTALATLPWASAHDLQALAQWNAAPTVDYPRQANVRQMLFERSQADPQALAVIAGDVRWTHAELHAQAWRIAHALRARGIGRGQLVGLCVNRRAPMVAALLGILASGACYVPLDPGFPAERLALMAEDAGLALVLAERDTANRLPGACAVLALEDIDPAGPCTPLPADAQLDARPEDAAYVIYTSGSTGRPKGVALTQRAVVNFLCSMLVEPGLAASDRLLAVTTLSFDISLLEMLVPPIVGAATIVASREQALNPEALRALLEQHQATAMQATPTSWRMLVDAGWAGSPGFTAITGGEPLAPDLAQQLLERCGALWNGYGPSETTVYSTMCRVTSCVGIRIGRPVANTTVWVLDERGQLCPVGVPGELCIGGAGVGIGYLNRAELTAEKFIADPFQPGQRLYRTGDRGRWRNDGTLEHLGRLDFQVKIRGFRIELGEVEATLQQSPGIAQSVAVAREDEPGNKRLVAYVVMQAGHSLDEAALRAQLRRTLPSYMLPQQFVALDALPLLPNGKINRKALPAPGPVVWTTTVADDAAHEPPATPTEQQVAQVWQELLQLPSLSVTADFFALGGHSLMAVRLMALLSSRVPMLKGQRLPLSSLLEAPTIRSLARQIDTHGTVAGVVTLREGSNTRPPVFLVHDGDGETLLYRHLALALHAGHSVYGLQPLAGQGLGMLHTRIPDMAAHYIANLRKVQPKGPYLIAGLCAGGLIASEMALQLQQLGQQIAFLGILDAGDVGARVSAAAYRKKSLRRFVRGVKGSDELPMLERMVAGLRTAVRKTQNLLAYEMQSRREGTQKEELFHELQSCLDAGQALPASAQELLVREIYLGARSQYAPQGPLPALTLFRAMHGDSSSADEPAGEYYVDADFGWAARGSNGLQIVDSPGGHVTMLQPPHVVTLAAQIQKAIDAGLQRRAPSTTA